MSSGKRNRNMNEKTIKEALLVSVLPHRIVKGAVRPAETAFR